MTPSASDEVLMPPKRRRTSQKVIESTSDVAPHPEPIVSAQLDTQVSDEPTTTAAPTTRKRKQPEESTENEKLDPESNSLTFQNFAKTPAAAQWCRGCHDDNKMPKANCAKCAHIVCYGPSNSGACLELVDKECEKPSWIYFLCPACEHYQHRQTSKKPQFVYTGFYGENSHALTNVVLSIRNREFTFFRPLKLPSLAVIQLQVVGSDVDFEIPFRITTLQNSNYASAVVTVQDVLDNLLVPPPISTKTLQAKPLVTSLINFDFNTPAGVDAYTHQLINTVNAMQTMGVNEVVIILVTHSDPNTGDLHHTPNGMTAERFRVVFDHLMMPAFREWLKPKNAHLFVLASGSKPFTKDAHDCLHGITTSQILNNVFLFPTTHLQPAKLAFFISQFVERVLFNDINVEQGVMYIL
ncbi:hypothetical protein K435DRAFT_877280 [Dendrothele bispora CBS 962.96]|uniref:Uncharacterized protein n=1 Tax=Dendrothele bispora (strain CBS 962.96) TaxID=1314807 RepID=A0A4V4HB41_DENBC|nr:hypothetical protein K435DRAFT_877280 [Dendrothele bispora CBS 962.96]